MNEHLHNNRTLIQSPMLYHYATVLPIFDYGTT